MIFNSLLKSIQNKDYQSINKWINNNEEKAKEVFQLFKSIHAINLIDNALTPKKKLIEILIDFIEGSVKILKGKKLLQPSPILQTRGGSKNQLIQKNKDTSNSSKIQKYYFTWGYLKINKETSQLDLLSKKPFKQIILKKNQKTFSHQNNKKIISFFLSKGVYQLDLDENMIQLKIK